MLAAIDDESDFDSSPKSRGSNTKTSASMSVSKGNAKDISSPRELDSEDYFEDEESGIGRAKPRGKLAARLQGHDTVTDGSGVEEEHASAYKRIRMQFLSGPTKESRTLLEHDGSEDDNEPLKSASRRIRRAAIDSDGSHSNPEHNIASHRSPPGLFLSTKPVSLPKLSGEQEGSDGSDRGLPPDPQVTSKVLQLVARKKAEREAKEAREARNKSSLHQKPQSKKLSTRSQSASPGVSEDDAEDVEGERRLTQYTRPTRKASKKAVEEMNRETQRMSRNMQLAHQAKTKKKITKESLFARFNFKTSNPSTEGAVKVLSSSTAPSSAPTSEFEGREEIESPPSSPPQSIGDTDLPKLPELDQMSVMNALNFGTGASTIGASRGSMEDAEDGLLRMFEIVKPPETPLDKGKGKAADDLIDDAPLERTSEKRKKPTLAYTKIHIQPHQSQSTMNNGHDSDSDLEILPDKITKTFKADVFDRLPATRPTEGRSLQTLRALAHLTSPRKKNSVSKASMSLSEMQASLQKRARQQAALERAEKIQDLKDRGVIVQTAEERERDQVEIEDLVEKARREAEEIMQKEKTAARKEKEENGEDDGLPDTSDEDKDEDYQDSEADEPNIELSGSEDEELVDEDEFNESEVEGDDGDTEAGGVVGGRKDQTKPEGLINAEASEAGDEEEVTTHAKVEDNSDESNDLTIQWRRRINHIIDEDEDEEDYQGNSNPKSPKPLVAVHNPLMPGPGIAGDTSIGIMGMTQAFAATMADSQTQADGENSTGDQEQDSLRFLGPLPEPNFQVFDMDELQPLIPDSQIGEQHTVAPLADIELNLSQPQALNVTLKDTQDLPPTATQYSDIPDPTQDVGFALSSLGPEQRFASVPPSTVDTVVLSRATGQETPKVIRKGRLRRRIIADDSDSGKVDEATRKENIGAQISANAFDILKKSKGKGVPKTESFDKKKSEAKEMVEDQAQESEDEYAGLGGASDDESGGSEDEEVRKMIEEGEVNVNESELAAFHA